MKIFKLALRLFGMKMLMNAILLFVSMFFYTIYPENRMYHWVLGITYIGVFWYAIYKYTSKLGSDDAKRNQYKHLNGFVSGLIATMPILIFYLLTELLGLKFTYIRLSLFPYDIILQAYGNSRHYLAALVALIFPIAAGISYMIGKIKWNKIKIQIEATGKKR